MNKRTKLVLIAKAVIVVLVLSVVSPYIARTLSFYFAVVIKTLCKIGGTFLEGI